MFTIPNILGFSRLIAAPIVALLVLDRNFDAAFWLFVIAGLTDAIDGPIARWMNATNRFGLFLDPIADKLLVNAAYLSIAFAGLLPLWVALLVFSRDVLIGTGYLASTLMKREVVVDPVRLGKTNTGLQILLVSLALGDVVFDLALADVIRILSVVVAITTTLSGLVYFARWLKSFSKGKVT